MASVATTLVVTLLLLVSTSTTSVHDLSTMDRKCQTEETTTVRHPFTRLTKGVKLQGGFMEIVHEEKCTLKDVRLTCRSLKAFIFVLDAEYRSDASEVCKNHEQREKKLMKHRMRTTQRPRRKKIPLRGNYIDDNAINPENLYGSKDLRISLNRRCSGHQHCRFNLTTDHPGANYWSPGALRLKYACIPETAVRKYCNVEIKVPAGVGGYIRSPGYPSYYPGGNSCGWIFRSVPGQRIVLTFHDLNIRSPKSDGSCVDVVRVRDNGNTLFEDCGTAAGVKVVSNGDLITLDLVASTKFYPARGFLVQYQVLGCADVIPPAGSYISNLTQTSRTFLCKPGTLFPDTKERKRIVECKNGKWSQSVDTLPSCVATSAVILKTENDHHRLSSLSGDNILGGGVRIGRGEDAVATGNGQIMDSAQSAMMKQADYVVDVVLPTVLIALLFVGNAIIVYIIFQYRKRKLPAVTQGEEMALRNSAEVPQV